MKAGFAFALIVQALLLQDASSQSIKKCAPTACTKIYAPVCDTNGKTHSNECEFKNYQCSHPLVKIAYKGECKKSGPGCEVVRCAAGTHCEEVPLPCLIPPCPTQAKCVPNTPTTTPKKTCGPVICQEIYQPVCGSDGKTYSNKCEFEGALCKDPSLTIVYDGECKSPKPTCGPVACPFIYQPVCASNGQTYSNKCVFEGALCEDPSLTIVYDGECKKDNPSCGPVTCQDIYQPVCASNGKTYANKCEFNGALCLDPALTIVHSGAC